MMKDTILNNYTEYNIKNGFNNAPFLYSKTTSSTMDDAAYYAARNAVHGTVLCTGYQSKGRGRFRQRKWASAPGENLLFTLILKKTFLLFPALRLPVLSGLALCMLFEEQYGFFPHIKWPNDILFDHKKLSGILWEAQGEYVFCGIGINCNQTVFPEELADRATSLIKITGEKIDPLALCEKVLFSMRKVFDMADWKNKAEQRLYRKGERVRVCNQAQAEVIAEGVVYGLDKEGALIVKTGDTGQQVSVISGEVFFL